MTGGRRGGNGHGGATDYEPPPNWPLWEQRVEAPDGRLWRVRTVDVLEAPGQLHPRLAKTVAETKGRFRTTVLSPRGAHAQETSYRETVVPPLVKARVSVEAGIALGWREVVGDHGRIVSIEHYGGSADAERLYTEFGITAEAVARAARDSIASASA